ncbi:MAG TPA: septum formation initiator family protein [Acidimicrobiales bacterium]|nr:septum formation initiator family protein [Acidimicrobiales bacterium]
MIRRRALLLVVVAVMAAMGMFLFGYPTRTYLDQRAQLTREQAMVDRLAVQNQTLQSEAARLQNTGEIERLARQDYGLVQPGQEAYAILPAPTPTPARTTGRTAAGARAGSGRAKTAAAGTDGAGGTGSAGSLWSRFLRQLEFWD